MIRRVLLPALLLCCMMAGCAVRDRYVLCMCHGTEFVDREIAPEDVKAGTFVEGMPSSQPSYDPRYGGKMETPEEP